MTALSVTERTLLILRDEWTRELRAVALEAAHHLRNLPATTEGSDVRMAEKLEAAVRQATTPEKTQQTEEGR